MRRAQRFDDMAGARVLVIGGRQTAYEWAALIRDHGAARIDIVHRHEIPRFERASWKFIDPHVEATVSVHREVPKTLSPQARTARDHSPPSPMRRLKTDAVSPLPDRPEIRQRCQDHSPTREHCIASGARHSFGTLQLVGDMDGILGAHTRKGVHGGIDTSGRLSIAFLIGNFPNNKSPGWDGATRCGKPGDLGLRPA